MNHTKKMLLIDPDTLGRMQQRINNPVNNTISLLDQEMDHILNLKHLTDDEKWLQYKQVLARFLHFTSGLRNPIALPVIYENINEEEEENKDAKEKVVNEDDAKDHIKIQTLKTIPKLSKNIGELLYDSLNSADIINWDKFGSVSVRGTKIPGSSIIDLISDVVRNRRDSSPEGWEIFAHVLAELNIPQEYILNAKRKQFIHQMQAKQHTPQSSTKPNKKKPRLSADWERFKF